MAAGVISATLANAMGDGKRSYKPRDFIPRWRPPTTGQELQMFFQEAAKKGGKPSPP